MTNYYFFYLFVFLNSGHLFIWFWVTSQYAQGLLLEVFGGTIWDAGDVTRVDHVQDKCPTHYIITPAPKNLFQYQL